MVGCRGFGVPAQHNPSPTAVLLGAHAHAGGMINDTRYIPGMMIVVLTCNKQYIVPVVVHASCTAALM